MRLILSLREITKTAILALRAYYYGEHTKNGSTHTRNSSWKRKRNSRTTYSSLSTCDDIKATKCYWYWLRALLHSWMQPATSRLQTAHASVVMGQPTLWVAGVCQEIACVHHDHVGQCCCHISTLKAKGS